MRYRLGLDVGSTSLGWWIWEENNVGDVIRSVDGGVRIYSDGRENKTGTSLAASRRVARGARRRRDRYLKRRKRLLDLLVQLDLMPRTETERKNLEQLNPYRLRALALDQIVKPYELGRVLFHLNQRRGFKSNRIAEKTGNATEQGTIRTGIQTLDDKLRETECRTIGEYLYRIHKTKKSLRFRPGVEVYPSRKHYEQEFDLIKNRQHAEHQLTDKDWEELRSTIFFQRQLRPVDPGRCTFFPEEKRAPIALLISQNFRILQEVNNLRIVQPGETDQSLDFEQRKTTVDLLLHQSKVPFKSLRNKLGIRLDSKFNLENGRNHLDGDKTSATLRGAKYFGKEWNALHESVRNELVDKLLNIDSEQKLVDILETTFDIDPERAKQIATVRLPQGYSRLSVKAMLKINQQMELGYQYHEAVKIAFPELHHSDVDDHEQVAELPYYPDLLARHISLGTGDPSADVFTRKGRIANPTVHIGLNQIRRVVNEIVRKYGSPSKIVIELARELKHSKQEKDNQRVQQAQNRKKNDERRENLRNSGYEPTANYLRKYRLWDEQGSPQARCCPYCGDIISMQMLLDHRTEVDHILPFSRTLDDSMSNKVVCCTRCNQVKGNRSPTEAFHSCKSGKHDYEKMKTRAHTILPANKKWRFDEAAMERFENEESDFLDRQLNDTRYLSRIAKTYIQSLVYKPSDVTVTPGKLTALVRGKWGLNELLADSNFKNRDDHRHHAIDAAVIALIDRSMLQRVATAAGQSAPQGRLIAHMPEPQLCPRFRDEIREHVLNKLIVVHRPRHPTTVKNTGTSGQLHDETALGILQGPDENDSYIVRRRLHICDIPESKGIKMLKGKDSRTTIADNELRRKLESIWIQFQQSHKTWKEFTDTITIPGRITRQGVKRIRCLENRNSLITIHNRNGHRYKSFVSNSNARTDIFRLPSGSFDSEIIQTFDLNQTNFLPEWKENNPQARLVASLHRDDLFALGHGSDREIYRVVKLSRSNVYGARVSEGGDLIKRHNDPSDPFRYLQKSVKVLLKNGFRKVKVNVLGHIFDPGPIKLRE